MSLTYKSILDSGALVTQVGTSAAAIVTVAGGNRVVANRVSVHAPRSNTTAEQVYLYLVPNGDSADDDTEIGYAIVPPGGDAHFDLTGNGVPPGVVMETNGDTLQLKTSTANGVNARATGAINV